MVGEEELKNLKILDNTFRLYGIEFGIPLCCLIWFYNVNTTLRSTLPEYNELMHILSKNEGVILCPKCVEMKISK